MKDLVNKAVTANYLQGMQTLTGKLYFYEDGFSFKADSVNGVIDKGKILYRTVTAVNKRNTLGLIPNGLSVLLDNKDELIFVLNGRNTVRDFLLSKSRVI